MSLPLLENLDKLRPIFLEAQLVLLGLDYDGTLTPIVHLPEAATLATDMRDRLRVLSRVPRLKIAVVSGRRLSEIRAFVGVEGLVYAGNHGLEITGPGFHFIDPGAVGAVEELALVKTSLAASLKDIAGAWIEEKGLTLSVHKRKVARNEKQRVRRAVDVAVAAAQGRFTVHSGKEVLEVRPRVDWHKGRAMRWIAERFLGPSLLTCFLGDDRTDEDAFRLLPHGVTIKVGDPAETCAKYFVDCPESVGRFLDWLLELYSEGDRR